MKAQGFTLIELLAVIVILAIIALIATPIVLGIIDDAKESAQIRSSEMYLKGVANAVMKENLEQEGNFKPTECTITSEGNLDCDDKEGILEVEVDGEKPKNGKITFEEGKIKEVKLEYETATIVMDEDGSLVYSDEENGGGSEEEETLAPGLYAEDGTMAYTWQQLLDEGYFYNDKGTLYCCIDNCGKDSYDEENGIYKEAPYECKWDGSELPENSKLVIDDSITKIGNGCSVDATYYSQITSIIIPNTVTSIGEWAFNYCYDLSHVKIPNSVTSIGSCAFCGCTSLASITIPDSVTSMDGSFSGSGLTSITIPKGVTNVSGFMECDNLKSVIIPDSVTSIDEGAFAYCDNLESITIPNSVTSIGRGAFEGSNLKSIIIPENVTILEKEVFLNCKKLETVIIKGNINSIGENAFSGCTNLTSIDYSGTKAEWNAIEFYSYWNGGCPEITVHCTGGDIIIPASNA